MPEKKTPRRIRRSYRPSILPLEPRALLAEASQAFSVRQDDITAEMKGVARLEIRVSRADFEMHGDRVLLGVLASADDSQLDPARIRTSGPARNRPRVVLNRPNIAGENSSLLLASVGRGPSSFAVRPGQPTTGGVSLNAFLMGDANSDFRVNRSDLRLIRSLHKVSIGGPRYDSAADVNRDGVINKSDTNLARRNLGASTSLRPLTLTAALDPSSAPDASGVLTGPDIRLVGTTRPGALVQLVRADVGTLAGAVSADDAGRFQFELAVEAGSTPLRIIATDRFGQRRTSRLTVVRRDRPIFDPTTDITAPSLTLDSLPEDVLTSENLTLGGRVSDDGSGVGSLRVQVDSGPLQEISFDAATGRFSYATTLPRDGSADGGHLVRIVATDAAGNVSGPVGQGFRLDTQGPMIALLGDASNRTVNANPTYSGRVTDAVAGLVGLSVQVDDGGFTPLAVDADGSFILTTGLGLDGQADGAHAVRFVATDAAGNTSAPTAQDFRLDTQSPAIVVLSHSPGQSVYRNPTLVGRVSDAVSGVAALSVQVDDGAVLPLAFAADGSFQVATSFAIDGSADGVHTVQFRATDAVGNPQTRISFHFVLDTTVPPDPSQYAPAIDRTIFTSMLDATSFLYTGPESIQTGVAPGTIDFRRAAVIRGKALDRSGQALSGVVISVLDHPEFGRTHTRADGMFDLAVNGGGYLTINYARAGYLPIQRQADVPWQDYAQVGDVALSALDSQVTSVDLASAEPIQVARGSVQTDEDGSRQATLLFPQGVGATMTLADGSARALAMLDVRATEFTVGPSGPTAMPGTLPATSGYTYAVELSVDQALAAGATRVDFDRPVPFYLENFLNFPVGTAVPAGYYDRGRGLWVPSDNGRVIAIVSESEGLASLDIDGDGLGDSEFLLAGLGVTEAERAEIASLYDPGQTLWRVPIEHFTPWDCNWPYGPPDGAQGPDINPDDVKADEKEADPNLECGSIIQVENQVLNEMIPVAGTPFSLVYSSDRVPGRMTARTLTVPLTRATLPAGIRRIDLKIEVAGRRFTQSFSPSSNQLALFTWDGKDAYGRSLQGSHPISASIGYVYDAQYYEPADFSRAFGAPSGIAYSLNDVAGRLQVTLEQRIITSIKTVSDVPLGSSVAGWSVNVNHSYDPTSRMFYYGNGRQVSSGSGSFSVITRTAGAEELEFRVPGGSGDGGPATAANLSAMDLAVAEDGTIYVADWANHRIRRIGTDGIITTVAGNGEEGFEGDGGQATAAKLNFPSSVAIGPDGSVFIADQRNSRIRRIRPDGIITTVAGNGYRGGELGDGGRATDASLTVPSKLALAPDGSLYISDSGRIRRVGPDGFISTVAGNGGYGYGGDGGPAIFATLASPGGLAVGPDGSLYIADTFSNRIRRIGPNGIISTIAGDGENGFAGDGGLATLASLDTPEGVALGRDGSIYIADRFNRRLRRVGPDGTISTVAGGRAITPGNSGDGGPATAAKLFQPMEVAVGPDGSILIASFNENVRRVDSMLPGSSPTDIYLLSDDGSELFVFDPSGRHLRTTETVTGIILYSFEYDGSGRLASIIDRDGNETLIRRNAAGIPLEIVSPFGQHTTLIVGTDGRIASVSNPAGESYKMTYDTGGLLKTFTDPRNHTSTFEYDENGRLRRDEDAEHGVTTLNREELGGGSYRITTTNAVNGTRKYLVERLPDGSTRRTFIDGRGIATVTLIGTDGTRRTTSPDGAVTTVKLGPDPRYGMLAPVPIETTVVMPSGLTSQTTSSRIATYQTPGDKTSPLATLTDTVAVNGKPCTTVYTASARTISTKSAEGRTTTTTLDAKGRAVLVRVPGVADSTFTYDVRGRLKEVAQATRKVTYDYDLRGNLQRVTDPLNRSVTFAYDTADRLISQTQPDNSVITFRYDAAGNMVGLTPPGQPEHTFTYDKTDRLKSTTAPDVGPGNDTTRYVYNLAHQLVSETLPSGAEILYAYCECGRLTGIDTPWGDYTYTYDTTSGVLSRLDSPGGFTLAFGYDGALPTSTTQTGPVAGSVGWTYDADFRVASESVNGGNKVTYGYDKDGLMTKAGDLTLIRDAQSGFLTGSTLGVVTDFVDYNGFGELASFQAKIGQATVYQYTYTRDDLGRIMRKVESIVGVSTTTDYGYDLQGRLETVTVNGVLARTYGYDGNGNRLSLTSPTGVETGTYDAQDRLKTYGTKTYTYTNDGYLQQVTDSTTAKTTRYTYDAFGNLTRVDLPDDRVIEYMIDAENRRVGKKLDGIFVEGWIYRDQLQPVAKVDASGNIVAQYVYGTGVNLPEYMIQGGNTYRLVADHLGSVHLVIDITSGEVAQRLEYDEFGQITFDSNPGFQMFGFSGGIFDGHTGLTRFGSRDLIGGQGVWTARDPISFNGRDTNVYRYVHNDPINYRDPTGRLALITCARYGFGGYYFCTAVPFVDPQSPYGINPNTCSTDFKSGLYRLVYPDNEGEPLLFTVIPEDEFQKYVDAGNKTGFI